MKKNILILLTLFCAVLLASPASALMKNEPEDFRGIPWFAHHKGKIGLSKWGLREIEKITVTSFFQRKNDKLQIGAAQLKSIEYVFLDNVGLVQVVIGVDNVANVDALLSSCTENWGEPKEGVIYDTLIWEGKKSRATLWLYEDGDSADLYISVKRISELIKEQENILTMNSKKDF